MNNVDVTYICMYTMNNNNIWRRVDQLNFRFGDELTSRPRRRDDQGDELTSHPFIRDSLCLASRNPALVYVFECTYERWVSKRGKFLNREVDFTEACGILQGVTHNFFRSY